MFITGRNLQENPRLSAAKKARLKQLIPQIDKVMDGDRNFFERFPKRRYRVRVTSAPEIEQAKIVFNDDFWLPPDWRWYAAIRRVYYARIRIYVCNVAEAADDLDLPEEVARHVFESRASPEVASLIRAAEEKEKREGLS